MVNDIAEHALSTLKIRINGQAVRKRNDLTGGWVAGQIETSYASTATKIRRGDAVRVDTSISLKS